VTRLVRLNPSGKSVPRAGGWARSSEDWVLCFSSTMLITNNARNHRHAACQSFQLWLPCDDLGRRIIV
jgi:hypothetical protein